MPLFIGLGVFDLCYCAKNACRWRHFAMVHNGYLIYMTKYSAI